MITLPAYINMSVRDSLCVITWCMCPYSFHPQLAGLSEYGAFAQVDQQLRAPKAQPGWEALFQAVRKYTSNMAEQV